MNRSIAFILLSAIFSVSHAQSRFTMPNPLVKPQSRNLSASAEQGGGPAPGTGVPSARLVEPPADFRPPALPSASEVSRLTKGAGGKASSSGSSGGPAIALDAALQSELSNYSVTAIYRGVAILRAGLGQPLIPAQHTGGQQANAAAGGNANAAARKPVLRVKNGTPFMFGSVLLIPTVASTNVTFSVSGSRNIVHTSMLESDTAPVYAVPTAQREVAEAGLAGRIAAPALTGISGAPSNNTAQPGR